MKIINLERKTSEVNIVLKLNIDGSGQSAISTSIKLFDHLLASLAKHACFDLEINAAGDLQHHIIEDVAIVLGEALNQALPKKQNFQRFGEALIPMDDALVRVAVDLCNRPYSVLQLDLQQQQVEDLKTEDIAHFFETLALASKMNLHITTLYGKNDHHKLEASMKAFAQALKKAFVKTLVNEGAIPSTKELL